MKLLNDLDFVWEVERGSSVAQLQRAAVVGLPDRKGGKSKKGTCKVAKSEAKATAKPPPPAAGLPDRDAKRPAVATEHGIPWRVASTGSGVIGPPFASTSHHLAASQSWRGTLSSTCMEIPASGLQSQAAGTFRRRTEPNDDRGAEDSESKDCAEASAARHNRVAQQANPLGNTYITHSQLQQMRDSEHFGTLSSLLNVNPDTSTPNVATANQSRLAALRQQHHQTVALAGRALMSPVHHLGLGPPGAHSAPPLTTLQALHGQRPSNHALVALLGGSRPVSAPPPPSTLPSALAGNLHNVQLFRALVNASLASPTSSISGAGLGNALSPALGGTQQTQTAASLFLPPTAPWLPSSLALSRAFDQHISDASTLNLANLMTGTSACLVEANALEFL
jgi:hypothetical protein